MNSANIMAKNVLDLVLSSVLYFYLGYPLAYGRGADENSFIGSTDVDNDMTNMLFQFSFAATASTIDSGALAERVNLYAYLLVSSLCCGVFYPIVSHWVWSPTGWLQQRGFLDFAGGMLVHGFGGFFALGTTVMA